MIAQMYSVSLIENLEKLFVRGGGLSQGTMVVLGNGLWEGEMIYAMHIVSTLTAFRLIAVRTYERNFLYTPPFAVFTSSSPF